MWTPETPLTVGDLRKAMEDLPDHAQAFVDGHPDRPIVGAIRSWQIPWNNNDWHDGDPQVLGFELWLGGDDEFPATREPSPSTKKAV